MAEDPMSEAQMNAQAQIEARIAAMGTVFVRAGRDDGRVAIWDTGPEYEDGEVMIKGVAGDPDRDFTYELPRTLVVARKIKEGALVEVDDPGDDEEDATEPASSEPEVVKAEAKSPSSKPEAAETEVTESEATETTSEEASQSNHARRGRPPKAEQGK